MTYLDNPEITINRLSAIFIFTLIISGNYIGELLPCKIQRILSKNMFLKHFLGLMTLFFFAVITIPELKNLNGLLISSGLYLLFLVNAKTNYKIWITVFLIYAFLYLINILKNDYLNKIESDKDFKKNNPYHVKFVENTNKIEWFLIFSSFAFTLLGVVMYIGEKKIEYGKKFNWFTFWTGKPFCRIKTPKNITTYQELVAAFS